MRQQLAEYVTAFALRTAQFGAVWWTVTEAAAGSWLFGVPTAVIAALLSLALIPPTPMHWIELLRFAPFFLAHSLRGGIDVARRALHPALPIAPTLVDYPIRLPLGLARVIFANTVSLLPGTLSVDLSADRLRVHVLDGQLEHLADLETLERRVARLLAVNAVSTSEEKFT